MNIFRRQLSSGHETLFFSTDIHSHVCPGIDDGSPSPERSVEIVEGMASLGIRKMIVTPHVAAEMFENDSHIITRAHERLRRALADAGVVMPTQVSAEYRIDELTLSQLEAGDVLPLPGNYLLVECPWMQEPVNLEGFLFDVQNRFGFRPILAHPERYPYFQANRSRYADIRRLGVLFQTNLLSLAGYYDKACRATAEWLLEHEMVDLIGSDAHRRSHVIAIDTYVRSSSYLRLYNRREAIQNDALFGGPVPENQNI